MRAACTVAARNSLDSARNPRRAFLFVSRAWLYVRQSTLSAVGAARRGHSRGFQRSSLCLIVLTRALCASLVPRGAKSASALATFFPSGCDSEASRSHGAARQAGKRLGASAAVARGASAARCRGRTMGDSVPPQCCASAGRCCRRRAPPHARPHTVGIRLRWPLCVDTAPLLLPRASRCVPWFDL